MSEKDYTPSPQQANQQNQPPVDTTQLLTRLTQLVETQNRLLQNQLQSSTPRPSESTAAEAAVSAFNDLVAALQLAGPPNPPNLEKLDAVSSTEIKLQWTYDDTIKSADGFKVWRCQGQNCESFTEIETKVSPRERSYLDRNLSGNSSYRYKVIAFNSRGETPSNIVEAKTKP